MTDPLLVWVLLSPLLGAAVALFGKLWKPLDRSACILGTVSLGVPLVLLAVLLKTVSSGEVPVYSLGGWPEPMGISLLLDGMAWISCTLTALLSLTVAVFSLGRRRFGSLYYFFLLMMTAGMYGVALTGDLFTLFICFEVIAVSVYVLIAYEGTATGLAASFKYLMLSSTGILFFLFGVFLIYRDLGVLSMERISSILMAAGGPRDTHAMHLALASLCVGIGVRTAFIPFHTWLPEAHAYAPHPISAFLSGAMIKISFFAMVRIVLQFGGDYLLGLLTWIGAFTAFAAVISALAQTDVKRLLAYHSISQLGYILAVFGAGSSFALTASFLHALNHAFFKSLLFLTVGAAVNFTGERDLYRIPPLGRSMPLFAVAFYAGALSISGIPPFNGFVSKALIASGMKGSGAYPLLWVTGFLTLASFIKLGRMFLPGRSGEGRTARSDPPELRERLPGIPESIAVSLLALLCLGTGVFGLPVASLLHRLLYGHGLLPPAPLFASANLLGMIPVVLLGLGAYRLVYTGWGEALSARVRTLAPELNTVLVFFFVGLLAFAAVAY